MKPNYTSFSLSSISILRIWFHSSKEQGCLFLTRNNVLRNRKIAKAIRLASSFQLFRLRHQTKELATKKSGKGGISTFNGHPTSKKGSTYICCIGLFQHQLASWKILQICEKLHMNCRISQVNYLERKNIHNKMLFPRCPSQPQQRPVRTNKH